ncbi:sigma-54 interaction domain-containing protein [Trichlorobacter lovleyi]|uniref:Putative phytochrome sensor protein n=1 Tax=Trichlorobacter lovleyi (strain ATCC BAA-1151 / DSM 17278 / SZ) TaxID=398767 RepID=B3E8C3_TRIL1|nr:sigma 54-interacting transcriptional regulator [Trichlorobacter lovleyi]ACD95160.1 putative phytochrome sensor protein [Trichlorobacter lovleyi SZ]
MKVKHEEFFREVTLRFCSSLDINIAIQRCFLYLRGVLPVDEIFLDILDLQLGAIRRIADVTVDVSPKPAEIIPLPEEVWFWAQSVHEPVIVDSTNKDPIVRKIAALTKNEGKSDLSLPLHIEGKKVGVLILRANGDRVYRKEHADLIRLVAEPIAIALSNALAHEELLHLRDVLLDDNRFLQRELSPGSDGGDIVGEQSGLRNVMEQVRQVAPLNNTVLLLGETGVGKEVIANAIHYGSTRSSGPFVKVNCGAIADTLIDSELFGHEKGAFTGAVAEKRGRFERANGGTLFLDEIGELPLQAQVKLLRVLQNRELERVGGAKPIPINIRIIAATNRNLEQMITEGHFREDLWFRINVFPIFIPPLRQRREDIPALARHLVQVKSRELGLTEVPAIALGALERLMICDWPGNVRELQNIVERELIRHRGGSLSFESLLPPLSPQKEPPSSNVNQELEKPESLDEAMAHHIRKVITFTKGKINGTGGAAELLRINPSTLRSRMAKLGVNRKEGGNP